MFSIGNAYIQSFSTRKTCHLTRFVIQKINFGIYFSYRKIGSKVRIKLRRFNLIYLFFLIAIIPENSFIINIFFSGQNDILTKGKRDFLILIFLPRNSENNWTKIWKNNLKKKSRTPSIPRRSPIQVLTGLDVA